MNLFSFNHYYENNLISESDILAKTGYHTFYIDFTRDINYYPYELVRHCKDDDEFYQTMYEWVESESWEHITTIVWDIAYDALVNFLDGDEETAFTIHLMNEHLVEDLIDDLEIALQ